MNYEGNAAESGVTLGNGHADRLDTPMTTSDELIEELERRVELRRQQGRYPIGLAISEISGLWQRSVITEWVYRSARRIFGGRTRSLSIRVQHAIGRQTVALDSIIDLFEELRETDARTVKQLGRAIKDRIMMVDALAEAVLELERKSTPEG